MPRHELTPDERGRGGRSRAQNLRAQREAAELLAAERLAKVMDRTLDRLEELLASDNDAVAMRAVHEILDRVLGRSTHRHEHAGAVELAVDMPALRAKLDRLVEQRAKTLAAERAA
jgi:hypothetical protein